MYSTRNFEIENSSRVAPRPLPRCSLCINGVWPTNRRTAAYHSHMLAAATFSFVLCKTSPFCETNIALSCLANNKFVNVFQLSE